VKWRRAREWNLLARWGARRTWFRKESHILVRIHKESYVLDRVDLGHLKVLLFWVSSSNESQNRFWFGSPVGGMFLMFQTYFRFGSNNESSLRDSLRSSSFIFKSSWIEGNWGVIILSKAYKGLNSDQSTINPLLTEINKQTRHKDGSSRSWHYQWCNVSFFFPSQPIVMSSSHIFFQFLNSNSL
jgi:hypothetical protein